MGWARLYSNVEGYSHLMQMLACGGVWEGRRLMGASTIDLMRSNGLDETQLADFPEAGYGYGYGFRPLIDRAKGDLNGSLGSFGWTGGSGTWAESSPEEGPSIVYMHNLQPNLEEYHHLRMRATAYGCL